MAGTHKGQFLGAPPTGRSIRVPLADFVRVSGGQIVEHWGITDTDAMRAQLGLGEE
jgi:predicted ester cyclase